jgi:hypothetical protein
VGRQIYLWNQDNVSEWESSWFPRFFDFSVLYYMHIVNIYFCSVLIYRNYILLVVYQFSTTKFSDKLQRLHLKTHLLFNTYLVMWKYNCKPLWLEPPSCQTKNLVAHGIGDTALIHFKITDFLFFIEVRPIIYQKLENFGQLLSILNSDLYGLNIKVSFHWSKDLNWHFCGKLFTYLVKRYSAKNIDICINFMGRTKTKPFLKRKKVPKFYFHFWSPKKCPPHLFNTYLVMWKYNCEPLCHWPMFIRHRSSYLKYLKWLLKLRVISYW